MKSEKGIALLTVIMALVALMIIAVPFALQMRKGYERSRDARAREKARMHVDTLLGFNKAFLAQTTERAEVANRDAGSQGVNSDPEVDTLAEITPDLQQFADLVGEDVARMRDPYGTILDWTVEDENGKFNINNCSPFALGNLLGLSVLAKELNESDSTIELEDASAFPPMGYVKVGRELIKYTAKDGNRLTGCERNVAAGTNLHGKAEQQASGMWAVNYAAWAIAYYHCGRNPGEWTRFDNLDVSDISLIAPGLDADVPVITRSFFEMVPSPRAAYSHSSAVGNLFPTDLA